MWVYLVKYVICIPETEGNNSKDNRVNKSFKGIIAGAVSDDDDVLLDLTDYIEGLQRSSSCSSFTIKRQKKQSYEIVDLWIPTTRERQFTGWTSAHLKENLII